KKFFGDLRNIAEVNPAFTEVELVLNISPISVAPSVVQICEELAISRVLFISSARKYSRLYKAQAEQIAKCEQLIARSSLDYIILRPTMIYGDERDRNINPLVRYLQRYRFFPLPYRGERLVRPLFVDDLVNLIIGLIQQDKFGRRAYDVAGPEALKARELLEIIGKETNTRFFLWLLPDWFSELLVFFLHHIPLGTRHIRQFLSFTEDRTVDIRPVMEDLHFAPTTFVEGFRSRLKKSPSEY
ncbi:MAG: hypothetical protein N2246_08400, partial [Candidatus Sumerlaeia bacterium]|nr:hypothetical protein [Candidatus Sumerlaeia bacterium]